MVAPTLFRKMREKGWGIPMVGGAENGWASPQFPCATSDGLSCKIHSQNPKVVCETQLKCFLKFATATYIRAVEQKHPPPRCKGIGPGCV